MPPSLDGGEQVAGSWQHRQYGTIAQRWKADLPACGVGPGVAVGRDAAKGACGLGCMWKS